MKDQKIKRELLKNPSIFLASLLYVGFIRKAPGTMGTLFTLPFIYLLSLFCTDIIQLVSLLILLIPVTLLIIKRAEMITKAHDPSWIVIDESLGVYLAWLFTGRAGLIHIAISFILFRFFDILKPWPVSMIDRKVPGAVGTLLDDLVAGLMAGFTYLLATFLLSP